MAGTTPGPWAGHQGNWDDEQDPTSLTLVAAFLLPWRWSPVLSRGVNLAPEKPLSLSILTLQFPPQPLSNPALRFIIISEEGVTISKNLANTLKKRLTCYTRMWRVSPELVLLWVGVPENIISNTWQQTEARAFASTIKHLPHLTFYYLLLPLSAIMKAAPRELRVCGCTTRKAACRLYVKGTQARSPNTSMKPKPSCTMSMVVRTASCSNTVQIMCREIRETLTPEH